ncbi:maternal protein exuperantia-1-like [Stegostoma tigrinum]|uniref:maternal protein exuperantia-1-like n=1 Tax=Stegostoma tigrinum TaxID=3053191 RepID=UPI00202B625A|nr:maternal protein exuperantia-1-like [Stegostoma tigrinum]
MASPENMQLTENGGTEIALSNTNSAVSNAEHSKEESQPGNTEETLVFFDLETTGLEKCCDIVQLSAVCSGKIFNRYILPSKSMSAGATNVTGIQVMDGILYLRGEPQITYSLQDTMTAFLKFLQSLDRPLLVGHNIWKFDGPIILGAWEELSMKDQFAECVTGFLDTLWLAKEVIPRTEVSSYCQSDLVQSLLKKSYEAHNAIEDVKSLQELYSFLKFTPEQKQKSQFSVSQLESRISLQPLTDRKVLFFQLADKLAMQDVSLEKMKLTYEQDAESGLKTLFQSLGVSGPIYIRLSEFFKQQVAGSLTPAPT